MEKCCTVSLIALRINAHWYKLAANLSGTAVSAPLTHQCRDHRAFGLVGKGLETC